MLIIWVIPGFQAHHDMNLWQHQMYECLALHHQPPNAVTDTVILQHQPKPENVTLWNLGGDVLL